MKLHFNRKLFIVMIGLFITSCRFSFTEPAKKAPNLREYSYIQTAKISLRFIQENKLDSLKGIVNSKMLKMTKPEYFNRLVLEGKYVIDNYEYPNEPDILLSKEINYSDGETKNVELYCFPFKNKVYKDSVKYFHITIANNKLYKIFITDFPPGKRIISREEFEKLVNKDKK